MKQTIHDIKVAALKGGTVDFADFLGKKVLVVNVASACGYTNQYQQLQELYEHFEQKIVVVGCPCNDFGQQEPGSAETIAAFCDKRYAVRFPMTEKLNILGDSPHALYAFLTKKAHNGYADTAVTWNFQKYLLDEAGHLIAHFPPSCTPLDEAILTHFMD